jgi:hypothetical protein
MLASYCARVNSLPNHASITIAEKTSDVCANTDQPPASSLAQARLATRSFGDWLLSDATCRAAYPSTERSRPPNCSRATS